MTHASEAAGFTSAGPVTFPRTLWTLVLDAKQAAPARAQEALGELCAHYREAILDYFRLKCRHHHDAEDLTGAFIAHLLERKRLGSFDRESCPRFRAYLSIALRNFFRDWLAQRSAQKRGDGQPEASIELLGEAGFESPTDDSQLARAVDLGFVRSIHRRVMAALAEEASDARRFEALRGFVPFEHSADSYEETAKRLGLSLAALRKAVFDLRKHYVQQFRAAVALTVNSARTEVDGEASELLDLLPEAVALEGSEEAANVS